MAQDRGFPSVANFGPIASRHRETRCQLIATGGPQCGDRNVRRVKAMRHRVLLALHLGSVTMHRLPIRQEVTYNRRGTGTKNAEH